MAPDDPDILANLAIARKYRVDLLKDAPEEADAGSGDAVSSVTSQIVQNTRADVWTVVFLSEDGGADEDAGQDAGQEEKDAGAPSAPPPRPQETSTKPEQIDQRKAEEVLDALRRNEKQFLMFQQKGKVKQRVETDKDW